MRVFIILSVTFASIVLLTGCASQPVSKSASASSLPQPSAIASLQPAEQTPRNFSPTREPVEEVKKTPPPPSPLLPPPDGGIPDVILHVARQELQHMDFRYFGQYRVIDEYNSFAFDGYKDDHLIMHAYWIGECIQFDEDYEISERSTMDTYVFFMTGKADGVTPALAVLEIGCLPAKSNALSISSLTIPYPDWNSEPDLWRHYCDHIFEIRSAYDTGSDIDEEFRLRKADLGKIEIPFFPGEEWDVGFTTQEQQSVLEAAKRSLRERMETRGSWDRVPQENTGEFTVYMPSNFAIMGHYILPGYLTYRYTSLFRYYHSIYIQYPGGFVQQFYLRLEQEEDGVKAIIEPERYQYEDAPNPPDMSGIVINNPNAKDVERALALGALETYTIVIE